MYRNIYYDIKTSTVHLWTWDKKGNRIKTLSTYEPFVYIEDKNATDAKSIFGTNLKKIVFENEYERVKYVKFSPNKRIFYNLKVDQQFLLSSFKDDVNKEDFGSQPLKIFYIDIETYATDHFSTPKDASDPINLITIYDSLEEKFHTWGCKNYYPKDDNVKYYKCEDEKDLLRSFIRFWRKDTPDIVTGWNIQGYDIPYIMNRITRLFDEEYNKKLSPVGKVFLRENASVNKLGRSIDRWYLSGVSILDYMELYESLCGGKRESSSLNYISEYELGENKIPIESTSLSSLADQNWTTFVDYNIQDVNLVVNLEKKLKYLKLVRSLSYKGFIPFEKSMGKVAMITGAVAHEALLQNTIIPTFNIENIKTKFAGGFVKEPEKGLYEDVITYDANSLYPNTIITLNISTETKIGKIIKKDDKETTILTVDGRTVTKTNEDFEKIVDSQKLAITKSNVLYTQKFKGVIPSLIDKLYKERVKAKNKMLEAKKQLKGLTDQKKIERLTEAANDNDILSNVYKVFLNSIYGAFSNVYFPLFDIDHAESVTLTGQAAVKEGPNIVYSYAKEHGFKGTKNDILIYQDTDSEFFSFKEIFKLHNVQFMKNGEITPEAYDLINKYGEVLNDGINEWAKKEFRSIDPRYVFKREKICDVVLLQAKKLYILHILDKEGVKTKEFEYKGLEVAKATLSKEVKELLKNVLETALLSKDRKIATGIFQKGYEDFCKMSPEQIATRKKINNYEKWDNLYDEDDDEFGSGTPMHVKSSMNFNDALIKFNLEDKYPKISSGTKIKFFYCMKNLYDYESIGFIENYPKEMLEKIKPDYKFMFEKNVVPLLKRIFQIIGWPVPTIGCEEVTDLMKLFS